MYPKHQKAGTFSPRDEDCEGVEALGNLAGYGLDSTGFVCSVIPHRIHFKDGDVSKLELFPGLGQICIANVVSDRPGLTTTGIFEALRILNLTSIGIQNRPDIGNDFAEFISSMNQIVEFRAYNTSITDKGLECILNGLQLITLGLSGEAITDSSVPALCKATSLRYLGIDGTSISKSGVEQLSESLPECTIKS